MKVVWSEGAVADLQAIYAYISLTSPEYGIRVVDRLTKRSQQIADFPNSGRVVSEFSKTDVREILEGNYRIIYRLRSDRVEVLTVIHGARLLPDL